MCARWCGRTESHRERIQSSRATQHIKHKRIKFIAQCVHTVYTSASGYKSLGLCTMWRDTSAQKREIALHSAAGGGAVFVYAPSGVAACDDCNLFMVIVHNFIPSELMERVMILSFSLFAFNFLLFASQNAIE